MRPFLVVLLLTSQPVMAQPPEEAVEAPETTEAAPPAEEKEAATEETAVETEKKAPDATAELDQSLSDKMDVEKLDLAELLGLPLEYGYKKAKVSTHLYLTAALWSLDEQAFGDFANEGSSLAGHPSFITYSGYVDIRGQLGESLMAEAEFELYKGQKGQFKVTRLRGVWRPVKYFQMGIGRDFPPISMQDKVYYPTSQYRLFAHAPYLYHSILRATGWWDAGLHLQGYIPLTFINDEARLNLAVSVINGPGDQHHDDDYLFEKMKPNAEGYMYESFHNKARQPWDNNGDKPVPFRVSFSPFEGLEIGGSAMFGQYDKDNKRGFRYLFGHLLYGGERLTVAAEFGQITVGANPANLADPVIGDDNAAYGRRRVTQQSFYVSTGYKLIYQQLGIEYLEPVVRYEMMDSWVEDDRNLGDRNAVWVGLRASVVEGWIIKAAYLIQWEDPTIENNGFIAETVFHF